MRYRDCFLDPPLIPGFYQCRFKSLDLNDPVITPIVLMCWAGFTMNKIKESRTKTRGKTVYRQYNNIIWSTDKGTDSDFGVVFDYNPTVVRELVWLDDPELPPIVENDLKWGILYFAIQNYVTDARWPTWDEISKDTSIWGQPIFTSYQNEEEAIAKGDNRKRLVDTELMQFLGYQCTKSQTTRFLPGYEPKIDRNYKIPKLLSYAGVTKLG